MPYYTVRFQEIECLKIVVSAETEDEAIEKAIDQSMDAISISVETDYYEAEEIA